MPWSADSVQRSVRRYLAMMLEAPWDIRTQREEIADDARPVAVIELGQGSTTRARASLEQGEVETTYPVTITAYPVTEADPRASRLEAHRIRAHLHNLIAIGLVVQDAAGRDRAAPFRLPLWDYSGAAATGAGRGTVPADPHDVMLVPRESVSVRAVQDPEDLIRWTVILELRVQVESPGRTRITDQPVVQRMPGTWDTPPPGP